MGSWPGNQPSLFAPIASRWERPSEPHKQSPHFFHRYRRYGLENCINSAGYQTEVGVLETKSTLYTYLLSFRFELISQTNSNNKVETCGILCGVLRDGDTGESLMITHLVIPKQKGGPDSCETLNEQDLFEFQVIP